jgi:hypothetical protein
LASSGIDEEGFRPIGPFGMDEVSRWLLLRRVSSLVSDVESLGFFSQHIELTWDEATNVLRIYSID